MGNFIRWGGVSVAFGLDGQCITYFGLVFDRNSAFESSWITLSDV
jgi:hypothetical protein